MNKLLKLPVLLTIFIFASLGVQARQESADAGLEKYLNEQRSGIEAIKIIKDHLAASGTSAPVVELLRWARDGFPELHNESGIFV